MPLKVHVIGPLLKIHGQTRKPTKQPRTNITIQRMTRPFMTSHNQPMMLFQIRTRSQVVLYSAPRLVAAVLQKLTLRKKERFIPPSVLGNLWLQKTYQSLLTGEIWMVLTIFHGIRISTSHNIVALAGLRDLHLQSLIDSTF